VVSQDKTELGQSNVTPDDGIVSTTPVFYFVIPPSVSPVSFPDDGLICQNT
jgi:hypothetical protein